MVKVKIEKGFFKDMRNCINYVVYLDINTGLVWCIQDKYSEEYYFYKGIKSFIPLFEGDGGLSPNPHYPTRRAILSVANHLIRKKAEENLKKWENKYNC